MESNAYLLDQNKINTEELSILEFLIKQVGLTGYKMVISNLALCASFTRWLSITSYPARPRRITVEYTLDN